MVCGVFSDLGLKSKLVCRRRMNNSVTHVTHTEPGLTRPRSAAKSLSSHRFFYLYPIHSITCNVVAEKNALGSATFTTQTGACYAIANSEGDVRVFVGSNCRATLAALTAAVALCGCASNDFDTSGSWFSRQMDLLGTKRGYTYSDLTDNAKQEHPITPNDLVDGSGACPPGAAAAPPAAAPAQPLAAAANSGDNAAVSADVASLIGGGVAIGMSECEVVGRLGQPSAVNFDKNPAGYRSAILTYKSGQRPGVYRFAGGRLAEMDRVEVPPAPEPAKKIAKKKPAKPKDPAKADDKT